MAASMSSVFHCHCHCHNLLFILGIFVVVGNFVYCTEEKAVLSLKKLQLGDHQKILSQSATTSLQRKRRHNQDGVAMLEMKHYDLGINPTPRSLGQIDYLQKLLISDEARVASIHAKTNKALISINTNYVFHKESSQAQVPLTSGVKLQTLNYVVTIGMENKNMTVIVDTGSDLTWVQCKPCISCYNQQDPLFDPSASPSFQPIPCNSTACNFLAVATGSAGTCSGADKTSCNYALSYGDGSYTRGVLATETIDLGGADVENFVFGCGRSNHGLFGGTSGLMGLAKTQLSLVSQTTAQFGGVFSYCLPTSLSSSGSLVLGDDPSLYSTPIAYTRMISDPDQPPFYFLNLTGFAVGGLALRVPTRKILIDSGTVITRLVPSVYKAVKAEFLRQFSGYPRAPSFSILDTCFNLSSYEEVKVPILRMEFEGGVGVKVDVLGVFYFVKKDGSQVCLAMASLRYEDQVGIIGNYQQKNQRVIYDTAASKIGFAEEECS